MKNTLVILFSGVISITLIVQLLIASVQFNPTSYFINRNSPLFKILQPQGWAFFTRNPREAQVVLYQVEEGKLNPIVQKHCNISNAFGLCRHSSRIMNELTHIRGKIQDEQFSNTRWNYQTNNYGNYPQKIVPVKNALKHAALKGNFILVLQRPVPWAWLGSIDKIMMPAKVIHLNIL